jgi:hypothetical protein
MSNIKTREEGKEQAHIQQRHKVRRNTDSRLGVVVRQQEGKERT